MSAPDALGRVSNGGTVAVPVACHIGVFEKWLQQQPAWRTPGFLYDSGRGNEYTCPLKIAASPASRAESS